MAWRFAPSKYKNTTPKLPKKDGTIYDLPIGNLSCTNNAMHSNSKLLAFLIDGEGGKIGVLPYQARGRRLRNDFSILCAHGDSISDFCFLQFDNCIATCSGGDKKLKIWSCEEFGNDKAVVVTSDAKSIIDVSKTDFRTILDCLAPHQNSGNLLAVGLATSAPVIVDLNAEKVVIALNSELDRSLSVNWSENGSELIVSTDKGKRAMIFDPRANAAPIYSFSLHAGIGRENRVIFANNNLVSSGFTANRAQEVLLYDTRDWSKPIQTEIFEGSTGLLLPLYDPDTKLLFLAGKGASKFFLTELSSTGNSPKLTKLHEQPLTEQTLGACLLPKTSCDVILGEVQRLHQLTKTSIVPIPCIVPRRSYQNFHEDLFPNTVGDLAGCTVKEWLSGSNEQPKKNKLGPDVPSFNANLATNIVNGQSNDLDSKVANKISVHYQDEFVPKDNENAGTFLVKEEKPSNFEDYSDKKNLKQISGENKIENGNSKTATLLLTAPAVIPVSVVRLRNNSTSDSNNDDETKTSLLVRRSRPKSCVVGTIQSKFRHIEVIAGANKNVFTNLKNVNNRLPTESNGFCISSKYAAVPLSGNAGVVVVFELTSFIKVPEGVIDGLQNSSQLMDLQWNPFCNDELAVGLDNGNINIWRIDPKIPCIGSKAFNTILQRQKEESEPNAPPIEYPKLSSLQPYKTLVTGQPVRITHVRYHSTVNNLLAVGLLNGVIQLWNIETSECLLKIQGHSQGILSLAWSSDGRRLASVGRDSMLKVYEPLFGQDCCTAAAKVLESTRAARVLFVCEDSLILLVGFSRSSNRQCSIFRVEDLHLLHTELIDISTQPLVPYYDYDTSVVFLTGKGDRTIQMFEICAEAPYFLRLSPTTFQIGHQAIAFFQKNVCDVCDVEFASGCRLTEKNMEKLSFKVPRIKKELFQRDVFPNALISWEPTCSAADWKNGVLNPLKFIDLRPNGMQEYCVSNTPITNLTKQTQASLKNQFCVDKDNEKKCEEKTDFFVAATTATTKIVDKKTLIKMGEELDNLKKQTEIGWSARITKFEGLLEQDEREGVDESEW